MTTTKTSLAQFTYGAGKTGQFYSLPALEKAGFGKLSRMPQCLRIVLESLARNNDGKRVRDEDVKALASWQPKAEQLAPEKPMPRWPSPVTRKKTPCDLPIRLPPTAKTISTHAYRHHFWLF